eukprot:5614365-Prymnesium_polylepis.2
MPTRNARRGRIWFSDPLYCRLREYMVLEHNGTADGCSHCLTGPGFTLGPQPAASPWYGAASADSLDWRAGLISRHAAPRGRHVGV